VLCRTHGVRTGVPLLYPMVDIPEALARSIQAGDCVLWIGAAFGSSEGRPGWDDLLRGLAAKLPPEAQETLEELVEQKRLSQAYDYAQRRLGPEALAESFAQAGAAEPMGPKALQTLRDQPWEACLTALYPRDVAAALERGGSAPVMIESATMNHLSLLERKSFFVMHLLPSSRALRDDRQLFDLGEELFRSRTVLFLGFCPEDPDFCEILELLERVGRGGDHYAVLPRVSPGLAEAWYETLGLRVLAIDDGDALHEVSAEIVAACQRVEPGPSAVSGRLAVLDLSRAVGHLPTRADLACDGAHVMDRARVVQLIERVESRLAAVSPTTLLQAGGVMLTHGRLDLARRCFAQVASSKPPRLAALAKFNLAIVALTQGDRETATEGLRSAMQDDRELAVTPPRYRLKQAQGISGTQLFLTCFDRRAEREVDVVVSTLPRPAGQDEQIGFKAAVKQLAKVEHPGVCRALSGFAEGRLFGVTYEPTPGFWLTESLTDAEPMTFSKAWELLEPLLHGLRECHARNVLHRNINPDNVVVGAEGTKLRGFGFPPVVGFMRPSVRAVNQGYLAPEVRDGEGERPASDVYAVAALAYRLFSGHVPQGSVPLLDIANEELDARVDPLLRRALHPDPSQRIDLAVLIEGLEEIAADRERGRPVRELDAPRVREDSGSGRHSTLKYALPEDPEDLEAWAWILDHKATHLEARQNVDRLEREARGARRWDRVVEVLAVKAKVAQAQRDRVAFLRESAKLLETELGAPGNAFSVYEELLAELETPEQVALVDEELSRLAEVTGRWQELSELLDGLVPRLGSANDQARLMRKRGKILAEHLHDGEQALQTYQASLDLQPHAEGFEALVPLHRRQGNGPDLAAALLSLADLRDGDARIDLLLEAASVFHRQMGDEEGAIGAIEIALSEAPTHMGALTLGVEVSRDLGRWPLLADLLVRRAELTDDRAAVLSMRKEAAELSLLHLSDEASAITLFQRIVADDPDDRESIVQLAGLLREAVMFEATARPELVGVLQSLLRLQSDPQERGTTLVELAGLLDADPSAQAAALEYRKEILELLPIEREVSRDAAAHVEAHYREIQDLSALENLLRRQATAQAADNEVRIEAWEKLLALYKGSVRDDDKALEALQALVGLDPEEGQWQGELASRYIEGGALEQAVAILDAQIAEATADGPKAALLLQAGRVHHKLGHDELARESWERAIDLEPELGEAWRELRGAYRRAGEPRKALDAAVEAARYADTEHEKVAMLHEAATGLAELGERERAIPLLEEVLDLVPSHESANLALLEALMERGELERAWPYAERHVEVSCGDSETTPGTKLRALSWAGRCALAVGDTERARLYIEQAKELDAGNLDLVRLLGDLDLRSGQWREALKGYQTLLERQEQTLSTAGQADLHFHIARARVGLQDHGKATQALERVLELEPEHLGAVELLMDIAQQGGPKVELRAKTRMLEVLTRREAQTDDISELAEVQALRVEVLTDLARLQRDDGQIDACIQSLEQLVSLVPDDQAVLHQLLDVCTDHKRWNEAVSVLDRLAGQQTSDSVRGKYLYAAAVIVRDNLRDTTAAAEWLRRVLEVDPSHARAFETRIDLLTKQAAWTELARAIRAYLKVSSKQLEPKKMIALFDQLAQTYRKLGDTKTALAALDQAARIAEKLDDEPEATRKRQEEVIRMAIQVGEDELDKAVFHGHAIIANAPMDFETYHRLVEIYLARGEKDNARVISRTLMFLHQADEAEEELVDAPPTQPSGTISSELFRKGVAHPKESALADAVFSVVWPMVASRAGHTLSKHGIAHERRVDVTLQSPVAFSRYLAYGCSIFEAPLPELFLRDQGAGVVVDALTGALNGQSIMQPSIVAGRDIVQEASEIVLRCRAGRAVAALRPESVLFSVLPSAEQLAHAYWGAVIVAQGIERVPLGLRPGAEEYSRQIASYLPAQSLEQLRRLFTGTEAEFDAEAWRQGVALTVNRAGFILADSVEVTAQIVTRGGDDGTGLSTKDRIADLIAYSVSRPYIDLRRAIGLAG